MNDGDYYVIDEGLNLGDQIVVKGNGDLVNGSAVTVVTLDGVAQDYIGAADDVATENNEEITEENNEEMNEETNTDSTDENTEPSDSADNTAEPSAE